MSNATNTGATAERRTTGAKRHWLLWTIVVAGLCLILGPTILIPAADRIYFALEERQLNNDFRRTGINGRATFAGRLFEGTMHLTAENLDDSKVAALATILREQRSIQIANSDLTWQGLQQLTRCKRLKYVMFADSNVSDTDLPKTPRRHAAFENHRKMEKQQSILSGRAVISDLAQSSFGALRYSLIGIHSDGQQG